MPSTDELLQQYGALHLENFAGISELNIAISPFTVIIGPQSVGKSVAAKLLYFFRGLPWELVQSASPRNKESLQDRLISRFLRLLPDPAPARGPCHATFRLGDTRIRLHRGGSKGAEWKIELPALLREAHTSLKKALEEIRNDEDPEDEDNVTKIWDLEELAHDTFWSKISEAFPAALSMPRFIPAGRSFYSQIERDIAAYFESASLDPFVSEFGKLLARLKGQEPILSPRARRSENVISLAQNLVDELLSGRYVRDGLDDYISLADGRKMPAKLWSSGQQEVQPLAFILQRCCEGTFRPRNLFIEEPEAHLFPTSQKIITELVSLAFNTSSPKLSVFITTHSPYILSTLNNLILAGQKHQSRSSRIKDQIQKSVSVDLAIRPGYVGAFHMDSKSCRSILDTETGLIDAAAIDAVSAEIADQFDAILQIDS